MKKTATISISPKNYKFKNAKTIRFYDKKKSHVQTVLIIWFNFFLPFWKSERSSLYNTLTKNTCNKRCYLSFIELHHNRVDIRSFLSHFFSVRRAFSLIFFLSFIYFVEAIVVEKDTVCRGINSMYMEWRMREILI